MKFIGREKELCLLRQKLNSDKTECMLIYGRRRVGKSELIKEALKGVDACLVQYVCRKSTFALNLAAFGEEVAAAFNDKFARFDKLGQLLEYVFGKAVDKKVVVVIDEYPFMRGDDEAIDSELQIAIDTWQHNACLKLILCGSYIDVMKKIIDREAPLFGRFSEIIRLRPFDYYDSAKFFPSASNEEKFFLYSVFGGIPFYLLQIDERISPQNNIERLIIPDGSVLENEIRLQLKMELAKEENANYVLEKIAAGVGKYSDLAGGCPGSNGKINHTLGKLEGMNLIEKDSPINHEKNHRYVISDNLLDFYYTYIFRQITARNIMATDQFYETMVLPHIESEYLPRKFEQLAKEYLIRENKTGQFSPPLPAVGRYVYNDKKNRKNGEFDVVAKTERGNIFYECKYKKSPVGMSIVNEELWQLKNLGLKFAKLGFFSKNSFSPDIDPNEYDLITLDDMYRQLRPSDAVGCSLL